MSFETNTTLSEVIALSNSKQFVDICQSNILENDDAALLKFKDFLQASVSITSDIINSRAKEKAVKIQSMDLVCLRVPEIQVLEPRGKFEVSFGEKQFHFNGKIGSVLVEWNRVKRIFLLPTASSAKKGGEDLLVFVLESGVKYNNKDIKVIGMLLPKIPSELKASYGPFHFTGSESDVISGICSTLFGHPLCKPSKSNFLTSTGTSFLRCYKGVQEGILYPLSEGLLFVKPFIFHAAESVDSIVAGRGGSALTKYIDLQVLPVQYCS